MSVILLLKALLACRMKVVTAGSNDIVAAVCSWVPDGLLLAH